MFVEAISVARTATQDGGAIEKVALTLTVPGTRQRPSSASYTIVLSVEESKQLLDRARELAGPHLLALVEGLA